MNKIKKISILNIFLLVIVPVFVFAQSRNEFPTGSGYTDFNRTAIQDPSVKNTDSLPTGSGYNTFNGSALQSPPSTGDPIVPCNDNCDAQDAVNIVQKIMDLTFMFAGFVVAVMFMYAGFLLITAAGDTGKIQKAKDIFKRVIIGFLIMYLSFVLISNLLTHIEADKLFKNLIQ